MLSCPEYQNVSRDEFERNIKPRGMPAILRGHAASWPLTQSGQHSPEALAKYLTPFANDQPVKAFIGDASIKGRFFYNEAFDGFNHERTELPFQTMLDRILENAKRENGASIYAGAIPTSSHLPGLEKENATPLLDPDRAMLVSLWIGNKTQIAAHWDLPQNLACVVAGTRRFTLFPMEQIGNLYVGPLDVTIAGQPCSIVDFTNPDFDRFPKFRDALENAFTADLEPGDALYMPSLWWHHVENIGAFGAMLNFWWRDGPAHLVTPFLTMLHALLTLKEMPRDERERWRTMLDHYIFEHDGDPFDHLPDSARGAFGPMTPDLHYRIRTHLVAALKR